MNHTLLRVVTGVLLQDRMFKPLPSSGFLRHFICCLIVKLFSSRDMYTIAVSEYNRIYREEMLIHVVHINRTVILRIKGSMSGRVS